MKSVVQYALVIWHKSALSCRPILILDGVILKQDRMICALVETLESIVLCPSLTESILLCDSIETNYTKEYFCTFLPI